MSQNNIFEFVNIVIIAVDRICRGGGKMKAEILALQM